MGVPVFYEFFHLFDKQPAHSAVDNPVVIAMRDDHFSTKSGIVILHPTKGTHWVLFFDNFYFDSYGCPPPVNIINQNGEGVYKPGGLPAKGLYSEYQIQKDDSYCAAYCLYILYLTQTLGFKNAVLPF